MTTTKLFPWGSRRHKIRSWFRYWTSRWPIAHFVNRSHRACWTRLCSWVSFDGSIEDLRDAMTEGDRCRRESLPENCGECYCGQFRNGERRTK